ncbi:hypothetical protein [Chromohalobacter sp. 48-RD10]|uniref:hypothetical protein n=1 Tax=Chromohalobacter sp. 48-RD10 TaxID=2994063 RepID=UPI0024682F69|nr:hypothetical protein [Chromohalobacter sp. 48-RD10]
MAALDHLKAHELEAEPLPGGRLYVWPAENITEETRVWIKSHKAELLQELAPANSDKRLSWRVIRGGKPVATMVGKLMSPEEALAAARARWSDATVEF